MMQPEIANTPCLVVLAPGADQGRRVELAGRDLILGRGAGADVTFHDPYVSRVHARLHRQGEVVQIEDLNSSGGTFVNGERVQVPVQLRLGDVVAIGGVQLRFGSTPATPAQTGIPPAARPSAGSVRFDIGQQHGSGISNVGRDQYNSYVQQNIERRENFLREIAATKSKARWLVWAGFVIFVAGFGLFAFQVLSFIGGVADSMDSGTTEPPSDILGADIAGMPAGLVGWALAAFGALLLTVGTVLHIIAAARRKRVDREYPVPPTWQVPRQERG